MEALTFPVHYENDTLTPLKPLPKNKKYDGILVLIEEKSNDFKDWSGLLKIKPLKLGRINSELHREEFYEEK